eukprot:365478-Chlamydomonas_euryale.AAC.6
MHSGNPHWSEGGLGGLSSIRVVRRAARIGPGVAREVKLAGGRPPRRSRPPPPALRERAAALE